MDTAKSPASMWMSFPVSILRGFEHFLNILSTRSFPRNWKCNGPFNLALLAPAYPFHGVLPSLKLLAYSDVCSCIFVHGKPLHSGRCSFLWQCNMHIHSADAKLSLLSAAHCAEVASLVQTPSIPYPDCNKISVTYTRVCRIRFITCVTLIPALCGRQMHGTPHGVHL